jgi:hypothetical protein
MGRNSYPQISIISESEENMLIQKTIDFFYNLFNKYKNINIYMVQSTEQGYMNFGINVMIALDSIKFRNNIQLLDYTNDEYNNNAEIDILFDHKFSNKATYEIYQEGNVIHFNFIHKNDKDFYDLLIIFFKTMDLFK